ncbi:MAG TPA: substrate-binding domain-containing protein [Pseudolabrys sp.]|nr:substrate-binding domain-containing protein [Pseudolabrys sp.]
MTAHAPDIKVFSTHALYEVLHELKPAFERASGRNLSCTFDPTKAVRRRIEGGEPFDVAIVTRSAIDALAGRGAIIPESCVDLGRSGLGLSVRKGAARPNIATVDALRRALLDAASIVRSAEGASGQYFDTLLDRLGIGEPVRGKIKIGQSGRVAELVANGEAEMAVQQVSELLPVAGADYVGPLPAELQLYTDFAAGIAATSQARAAAQSLIDMLAAPAARPLFEANGLEPAGR